MVIELLLVVFTGLVFGSFITCASYRLPLDQEVVKTPSYCPKCNTKLSFKDLWPVVSWVLARGKCRHCAAPVHWRYPVIEVFTAAIFLLIYARLGISLTALVLALMAVALLIMIVADFEHYIIPDEVHYALLPLGLLYQYLIGNTPEHVLAGFVLGTGLGLALHYGYRWLRKKEGLGFGDVKFFAVAGIWLGLSPFVVFIFISGVLGVLTGLLWRYVNRGPVFPFGPALAVALFICILFPEVGNILENLTKHPL